MLVLTRKLGEVIKIGDRIKVVVVSIEGGSVKLGVEAPEEIAVHRQEIYDRIAAENKAASDRADREQGKVLKDIMGSARTGGKKPPDKDARDGTGRDNPGKKNG